MSKDAQNKLGIVFDLLVEYYDWDCLCEYSLCSVKDPKCDVNRVKKALNIIDVLMSPKHESVDKGRLAHCINIREEVFSSVWAKEQVRQYHGNKTLLETLLNQTIISQEQATAAATVIQWLGTNSGYSFLWQCNQEIDNRREITSKLESTHYLEFRNKLHHGEQDKTTEVYKMARTIGLKFFSESSDKFEEFCEMIESGFIILKGGINE